MDRLQTKGFHFHEGRSKWLAKGITYGPFRPDSSGIPYPGSPRVNSDLESIASAGANVIRIYDVPPESLARLAADRGLRLLVDIPWPKHLNLYESAEQQSLCLKMVRDGVGRLRDWPNVMGVFLGNEIPADVIRWAGVRKVESFLRRLFDEAKEAAPEILFGYANFPSTEFLRAPYFDFLGFNVYLHDPAVFRNYLVRLRHLHPERPLVLSEIGMDTQRHTEAEQAGFLSDSLAIAYEAGMAGAAVFSWTDEWHTGGFDVEDWSFGVVTADRKPKPALRAVSKVFRDAPQSPAAASMPKVSVVVATYNGAKTLRGCLQSLGALRYPDFEIIVVDDGSTDETPRILTEFPNAKVISQPNRGLSEARNAGIRAAAGEIVAFTDSDCVVDGDWLYHIAKEFEAGNFVGVGGPNLTPEAKTEAARCVALAPGHATHVLIAQDNAEHIPGCNMAFRRSALLDVAGFDPIYRKAGDDVDIAWRLQDAGGRIGFTTAGFVWHHRRPGVKAFLKQQIGYGEAEVLLLAKHPHRFNDRGQSIWRGSIYSGVDHATLLANPDVNYGIFGSAGYQCIYEPRGSMLPYVFTSLEWWLLCIALIGAGFIASPALHLGFAGIALALALNGIWAYRKWSDQRRYRAAYWPLVWALWVLQPIARAGARYWYRFQMNRPAGTAASGAADGAYLSKTTFSGTKVLRYWAEQGLDRLNVLNRLASRMAELGWILAPNSAWESWDFTILLSWWFKGRIGTAEENHGERKRLLYLRYRLMPTSLHLLLGAAALILTVAVGFQSTVWARGCLVVFLLLEWMAYREACRARARLEGAIEEEIEGMGFIPMDSPAKSKRDEDTPVRHEAGGESERTSNI